MSRLPDPWKPRRRLRLPKRPLQSLRKRGPRRLRQNLRRQARYRGQVPKRLRALPCVPPRARGGSDRAGSRHARYAGSRLQHPRLGHPTGAEPPSRACHLPALHCGPACRFSRSGVVCSYRYSKPSKNPRARNLPRRRAPPSPPGLQVSRHSPRNRGRYA